MTQAKRLPIAYHYDKAGKLRRIFTKDSLYMHRLNGHGIVRACGDCGEPVPCKREGYHVQEVRS
jgi:hypothetical protein